MAEVLSKHMDVELDLSAHLKSMLDLHDAAICIELPNTIQRFGRDSVNSWRESGKHAHSLVYYLTCTIINNRICIL